jgi:hypothetical protein
MERNLKDEYIIEISPQKNFEKEIQASFGIFYVQNLFFKIINYWTNNCQTCYSPTII